MTSVARVCSIEGCERPRKAKGYCDPHWQRARSGRNLTDPIREVRPGRTCSLDGCERPYLSRNLCSKHYQATYKAPTSNPRKAPRTGCVVSGCPMPHESCALCANHARTLRIAYAVRPRVSDLWFPREPAHRPRSLLLSHAPEQLWGMCPRYSLLPL